MSQSESSTMAVACNVYVSAGRRQSADLLLRLLERAQGQCHNLRAIHPQHQIAVVHAFADGPYDRSSFHLAGGASSVATVATDLAKGAIEGLMATPRLVGQEASRHPFVGLVDHVSVMPLPSTITGTEQVSSIDDKNQKEKDTFVPATPSGEAARRIGKELKEAGVQVYYYGGAHPQGTPLATVRREQTAFFKSGGLEEEETSSVESHRKGVATVGAPSTFVENYNVRLTIHCDVDMARSLTRTLRERNGGLTGVEALTLPYSKGRFEIACNLLRPDVGSSDAIDACVETWAQDFLKVLPSYQDQSDLVETAYRVGTTAEQCLEALSKSESLELISIHDEAVTERFKGYLSLQ